MGGGSLGLTGPAGYGRKTATEMKRSGIEVRSRAHTIAKMRVQGGQDMKDKIFGVLQRVGRSFMLPIAILPVAGLLLGIGSSFTNATTIETYKSKRPLIWMMTSLRWVLTLRLTAISQSP